LNVVSGLSEAYQQYNKKYTSSHEEQNCHQQLKHSSKNEIISSTHLPEAGIVTQISSTLSEPPKASMSSKTDRMERNNSAEYQELITNSSSLTSKVNLKLQVSYK